MSEIEDGLDLEDPQPPEGLSAKRIRFCQEYVAINNGTQAAIVVGYAEASAGQIAAHLLKIDKVAEYVAALRKAQADRAKITGDRVLNEIAKLAFSDLSNYFTDQGTLRPLSDLDPEVTAALQGIKTTKRLSGECDKEGNPEYEDVIEVKLADKKSALELLGKNLKLFTDKTELDLSPETTRFIMNLGES